MGLQAEMPAKTGGKSITLTPLTILARQRLRYEMNDNYRRISAAVAAAGASLVAVSKTKPVDAIRRDV